MPSSGLYSYGASGIVKTHTNVKELSDDEDKIESLKGWVDNKWPLCKKSSYLLPQEIKNIKSDNDASYFICRHNFKSM